MKSRWSSGKWLARLGIVDEPQPEIIPVFQPTIHVADQSELFAPLPPPSTWFSGQVPTVALQFQTFEILSRAPGGSRVSISLMALSHAFPAAVTIFFAQISDVQLALQAQTELDSTDLFLQSTSRVLHSSELAAFPEPPGLAFPMTQELHAADFPVVYVPPGKFLYIQSAFGTWFSAVIRDIDEPLPDPIA